MSTTRPGGWPSHEDYRDAIQTPGLFFTDTDLQAAEICTNLREIPLVFTGRSAIVFKAKLRRSHLAIRCFTRSVPEVRDRYVTFRKHLRPEGLPRPEYFVDFKYRDEGVLVDGIRYPLLRMDWSQGEGLRAWVGANRAQRDRLHALASRWREVMDDLHARGIAHGDLASDNCLVRSGSDFSLIDYDGCFIPQLAHVNPGEFGHPDYRHPKRSGYYGPAMDAFPALVIYLSLLAVAAEPALWDAYNDEDANLIFTAEDYGNPGRTDIWARLRSSPENAVRALTDVLAEMCVTPIEHLPSLGEVLKRLEEGPIPLSNRVPLMTRKDAVTTSSDLDWINDPMAGLDWWQGAPAGWRIARRSPCRLSNRSAALAPRHRRRREKKSRSIQRRGPCPPNPGNGCPGLSGGPSAGLRRRPSHNTVQITHQKLDFIHSHTRPRNLTIGRGAAMAAVFGVNDFLHPLDLSARQQLESVPLLQKTVTKYQGLVTERRMRQGLLASAVRLGPFQLPEIYKLLPPICAAFGIEVPELYLTARPGQCRHGRPYADRYRHLQRTARLPRAR